MSPYLQGDIAIVPFDPSLGHEPAKTRPALVVSTDAANRRMAMPWVCPITSADNGYPLHVRIDVPSAQGWVCCEQLQALDLDAHEAIVAGTAGQDVMGPVLANLAGVLGV